MKVIRLICRIVTGLVFIFSGIVKAVDPLGSAYKFHDYFQAFHLDFMIPFAIPLAILLCTAEFISGFSVLSGYRQKTGILGVLILMLIFTPLTFTLAITNPVSDCGCFGDAIHLTNWQTFWKNIVLLTFAIILFTGRKNAVRITDPVKEWSVVSGVIVLFITFSLLNLKYLPLIDFLPYKTGNNIPELMVIPPGKAADEYETTFIYEKDGRKKEFTLDNYPADDSTWKFVDQRSILLKKGSEPPVHDFIITTREGEDITGTLMNNNGLTLLMISKKLEEARPDQLEKGFWLGTYCLTKNIDFYIITASGTKTLAGFNNGLQFCIADETTLKTMIRANPGYILLRGGTVVGKWSWSDVPPKEKFGNNLTDKQLRRLDNKSPVLIVYTAGLSVIVLVLLISSFFRRHRDEAEK